MKLPSHIASPTDIQFKILSTMQKNNRDSGRISIRFRGTLPLELPELEPGFQASHRMSEYQTAPDTTHNKIKRPIWRGC